MVREEGRQVVKWCEQAGTSLPQDNAIGKAEPLLTSSRFDCLFLVSIASACACDWEPLAPPVELMVPMPMPVLELLFACAEGVRGVAR